MHLEWVNQKFHVLNHLDGSQIGKKGFLQGQVRVSQEEKVGGLVAAPPAVKPVAVAPVSDSEAVRVFALMKALDDGQRNRKAPLGRVFRLLVLEGLSQAATAKQCGCSPGLVSARGGNSTAHETAHF